MTRSLIVGATGFLGSHLAAEEIAAGNDVFGFALDGRFPDGCEGHLIDLMDIPTLERKVAEIRPDVVYHLAAMMVEPKEASTAGKLFQSNITVTAHLLHALSGMRFSGKILLASSSAVYGRPARDDGRILETDPLNPVLEYGLSKVFQEQLVEFHAANSSYSEVRARLFNITGPGEPDRLVVKAFCRRAAVAAQHGADSIEVGPLGTYRDFLDVRDAASALAVLMHGQAEGAANVGSGEAVKVRNILERILGLSGISSFDERIPPKRHGEVETIVADNGKLRSCCWSRRFSLEESIDAVWEESLRSVGESL